VPEITDPDHLVEIRRADAAFHALGLGWHADQARSLLAK
jgi:hypothetical protein